MSSEVENQRPLASSLTESNGTPQGPDKKPKIMYAREFLLSLAHFEACKLIPRGFNPTILSETEDAFHNPSKPFPISDSGILTMNHQNLWQYGLLGNAALPAVYKCTCTAASKVQDNYSILHRSDKPYQPPTSYKSIMYSEGASHDFLNDETFGSSSCPSEEKVKDERRRKASFDSMRKEIQNFKKENQKKNLKEREENLDSEALSLLEDPVTDNGSMIKCNKDVDNLSCLKRNSATNVVCFGMEERRSEKHIGPDQLHKTELTSLPSNITNVHGMYNENVQNFCVYNRKDPPQKLKPSANSSKEKIPVQLYSDNETTVTGVLSCEDLEQFDQKAVENDCSTQYYCVEVCVDNDIERSQQNVTTQHGAPHLSLTQKGCAIDKDMNLTNEICLPDEDNLITVDDFLILPDENSLVNDPDSMPFGNLRRDDPLTSLSSFHRAEKLVNSKVVSRDKRNSQLAPEDPTSIGNLIDNIDLETCYNTSLPRQGFPQFHPSWLNTMRTTFYSIDSQPKPISSPTKPLNSRIYYPHNSFPHHCLPKVPYPPWHCYTTRTSFDQPNSRLPLERMPSFGESHPHLVSRFQVSTHHSVNQISSVAQQLNPMQRVPFNYQQSDLGAITIRRRNSDNRLSGLENQIIFNGMSR